MNEDYIGNGYEFHYAKIHPHKIYVEKYLSTNTNSAINDYKIFCLNGNPEFIQVCYERDEKEVAKRATYSLNWEKLNYTIEEDSTDIKIECPQSLESMIEYAKILSKPFPFVRVDFYDCNGVALLSELTFTPYGSMLTFYKPKVLDMLGKKLTLPPKYKGKDAY